jgi:hypothetical protein
MKPRQQRRAPLTVQDWNIWLFKLGAQSLRHCPLYEHSVLFDRRDADLMLESQRIRHFYGRFNPLIADFEDTDAINMGGSLRDLWAEYPELCPEYV